MRDAVQAIITRDGLQRLVADDIERLVALYSELQNELAQLRASETRAAEPAVIFSAESGQ